MLKLYDDHSVFDQDMDFQVFMRRVKSREVKKIRELKVDLDPVLQFFTKQGLLSDLPVKALTEKLCWMLAVVGMLHPNSIRCIDLSSPDFKLSEDFVILPILAPKEKRRGQSISWCLTVDAAVCYLDHQCSEDDKITHCPRFPAAQWEQSVRDSLATIESPVA